MPDDEIYVKHLSAAIDGTPRWLTNIGGSGEEVELNLLDIGEMDLPTGKICVCDRYGLSFEGANWKERIYTLLENLTPGRHAFQVCIATYQPDDPREHHQFQHLSDQQIARLFPHPRNVDQRIALAVIRIPGRRIVRWELAELEGSRFPNFPYRDRHRLGIDADVIAFADAAVFNPLGEFCRFDQNHSGQLWEKIVTELVKNERTTCSWAVISTGNDTNPDLSVCTTGFGSGGFNAYWGFDSAGMRVCLATDFNCLYYQDP